MDLSQALEAFGQDDFAKVLEDEIEQRTDELPLDELLENGGWVPEDACVAVRTFRADEEYITARIDVFFTEDHPSGCADFSRTDSYRAQFTVQIHKQTGEAAFACSESENTTDNRDNEVDVGDMTFDERADYDHENSEF